MAWTAGAIMTQDPGLHSLFMSLYYYHLDLVFVTARGGYTRINQRKENRHINK